MTTLVFYEKTGCITNSKQKALLRKAGIDFRTESLLDVPWTPERLAPFFADRPVREWINPNAPQVKSGEVDPSQLTENEALAMMTDAPILIRRPLIDLGNTQWAGFDLPRIAQTLGIAGQFSYVEGDESCSNPQQRECP